MSAELIRDIDELLDSKVRVHDKHRFELKLDVGIQSEERHLYRVDTYFFIPRPLGVTPSTYTKTEFYNAMQRYIRFKTPRFGLGKLRDPESKNSPLVRVKAAVDLLLAGDGAHSAVESAYHELKLLGCVVRVALRDQARSFEEELARLPEDEASGVKADALRELMGAHLADILAFIEELKALRVAMAAPAVPDRLREALAFIDEFFSLNVEESLTHVLESLRARPALRSAFAELDAKLADLIKGQEGYRAEMGYPSLVDKPTGSETLMFRRGVLKKFVSNVLYLQIETSNWERWAQVLFGVAAALAMALALLVTFLATKRFDPNSLAFAAVIVAGYVAKDRVKDLLKLWFVNRWTRWFSDRRTDILDPTSGTVIGRMREAFSFLPSGRVPPEILRRRLMDRITSLENEGKPEDVLRYEKEVELFPRRITKFHERRKDLNDILRLNVLPFLAQADDPKADYTHLNPRTGKLEVLECSRVYHVNVILRYLVRNGGETEKFDRFRIILDRKGIKRLEEVALA